MKERFSDHFSNWDYLDELIDKTSRHLCSHEIRMEAWRTCKLQRCEAEAVDVPVSQVEWDMGMRKENLEPQVREAVLRLQEKGYTTTCSGFEGSDGRQTIDFFSVNPPSKEILRQVWALTDETGILTHTYGPGPEDFIGKGSFTNRFGLEKEGYMWNINFWETSGDMKRLKSHWDLIADRLPASGEQRLIRNDKSAQEFRRTHRLQQ
ncbi:hypothetical protein A2Z22_03880 [Candidatus Woesebacteria bacterium RBG_16_34_12]|uniref:Uncharacterized protein n=1 Tax=Candidatus Woesebacteria bacterium RBG_16_34_12 TaxID=1802480 RepID=A0A1F7X7C6_9BACT|nr:MAG: hypothetical protein A2Z22_03880 [Candidatus Woesebacteria bacterium RBG_16_34_12]